MTADVTAVTVRGGMDASLPPAPGSGSATKRCPACAEEVRAEATVCRFCGYDFATMRRATPPTAPRTNGLAIASLVLGILWLYWIGSILALVFGYSAKSQIDRSGGVEGGRGLAVAGIVLGWVGVGTLVLFLALLAAASERVSQVGLSLG